MALARTGTFTLISIADNGMSLFEDNQEIRKQKTAVNNNYYAINILTHICINML